MRLKRVRIFGFKTFADRTEFSLEGGVIAVVGPNGCGKSNLVDAILWGLGEGSARQLRAQTGQDVIFNGSARRKGVGFAEVTLLFDNEDGELPMDTPEVALTRRLTRSGESEYSINRRPCRQRDVYELLADSGLGRAGYAIVGQKEIDAALNASVEDRRGWIDEAAGVQRYRQRKSESLRRLAAAEEHLQRVSDILNELESQREPLRIEAEQAARYRSLQATLQEVEVGYLIKEVVDAETELAALDQRIGQSQRLAREESNRADALEERVAKHGAEISQIEVQADDARASLQEQLTAAERAEAEIRLKRQKLEALDEQEQTLALDRVDIESRLKEAELEESQTAEETATQRATLKDLQSGMVGVGEESLQLSLTLKNVERELSAARESQARRLKHEADLAHKLERLKLANRELEGAKEALPDLQAALVDAEASIGERIEAVAAAHQGITEFESKIELVRAKEEQGAREVRTSLAERASLEGRKRGIEATIDSYEGLAQGAKSVLEAAKRGLLSGVYLPVGQAVEAKREHAVAIETALGGSSNDLIVSHESEAKVAIAWLKENRAGRATFQPIPLMRSYSPSPELQQLLVRPGVIGTAAELVDCDQDHRPVIDSLLGRILVVKDLDFAFALARTSGWSQLVTLAGEIVHSSGAVTGGHQAKQGYGLVQRKADLTEIERELGRLDKVVETFEKSSALRSREIEELGNRLPGLKSNHREAEQELADARSYQRTLQDELKSAQREIDRLEREIAQPLPVFSERRVDLEEIETRKDAALRAMASKVADVEQAESRLREAKERLQQADARHDAAKKRLEAARHASQSRERRAENIEPERARARKEIALAEASLASAKQLRSEAEVLLDKLQRDKRTLLEESLRLTEEAKHIRDNVGAIGDAVHQAEISRTRADARRSGALVRLAEDYGLSPDEVAEAHGKYDPPVDAPAIVQRLRRDLRAMGDVNLGAVEAYERLSARFFELDAQKEDVQGGIAEVEASIQELDKLTRDRFADTFAKVQTAFTEMFEKLFGGGEGKIALTDASDILNSGIEIEVTLPGKKRQALNLLSGGERALCTAAFLFALLKVKPSPLVILDEVDAPLDGRNVERFAATLREFSERSQFIVITHNENTIASAPVWLGVTMQEPGVSTLLPARRPDAKRQIGKEIPSPV